MLVSKGAFYQRNGNMHERRARKIEITQIQAYARVSAAFAIMLTFIDRA